MYKCHFSFFAFHPNIKVQILTLIMIPYPICVVKFFVDKKLSVSLRTEKFAKNVPMWYNIGINN